MPGGAVLGQTAGGDQAMDMGVIVEPLRPAMEDREDADRAAEPAGIAAEIDDRLGCGVHQSAIALALTTTDQGVERLG